MSASGGRMRKRTRILIFAMPWVTSFVLLFFGVIDGEQSAIINIGGTIAVILVNVVFWNTKPKKLITP